MHLPALGSVVADACLPCRFPAGKMMHEETDRLPPQFRAIEHAGHGILDIEAIELLGNQHHRGTPPALGEVVILPRPPRGKVEES